MKYRVDKGTDLFDKLMAFRDRMQEVAEEASKLIKEIGGSKRVIQRGDIAGGIRGLEFPEQPKNWRKVGPNGFYFPKDIKSNKELIARFHALPMVNDEDLNKIVGFKPVFSVDVIVTRPSVIFKDDYILLSFSRVVDYTPVEGMVEILVSEHKRLSQ